VLTAVRRSVDDGRPARERVSGVRKTAPVISACDAFSRRAGQLGSRSISTRPRGPLVLPHRELGGSPSVPVVPDPRLWPGRNLADHLPELRLQVAGAMWLCTATSLCGTARPWPRRNRNRRTAGGPGPAVGRCDFPTALGTSRPHRYLVCRGPTAREPRSVGPAVGGSASLGELPESGRGHPRAIGRYPTSRYRRGRRDLGGETGRSV